MRRKLLALTGITVTSAAIGVLLFCSVLLNIYLITTRPYAPAKATELVEFNVTESMKGITEAQQALQQGRQSGWTVVAPLWQAVAALQTAAQSSREAVYLAPVTPSEVERQVQKSRLSDLWPVLQRDAGFLRQQAIALAQRQAMDRKALDEMVKSFVEARFPVRVTQREEWTQLDQAVARYAQPH